MSMNLLAQMFDTIGLEVEGTLMDRDAMENTVLTELIAHMGNMYGKLRLDRDASTESIAEYMPLGGKSRVLSVHTPAYKALATRGQGQSKVFGYEFQTTPLEVSELKAVLYPLFYTLYKYGDVISDRSSIHGHVGFGNNFRMLKSLLRIMLSLEPALYRLGGMGRTFRGHLNNAAYCRPLLNSCAVPVARTGSRQWAQIVNPLAALEATNISDFWASMGIDVTLPSQHKYHGSRYAGMNFYALYAHGTAEWRYFNKSFDVPLVISILKFMRATVETASLVSSRDLLNFDVIDSNKEISDGDAEAVIGMILALCHEKGVDNIPNDAEMSHLLDVLKESHFTPLPTTPTLCHISQFSVTDSHVKRGNLKVVSEVLPSNYVDIHNIEDRPLSIFA